MVFHTKLKIDRSLEKYKPCVVAKGVQKIAGIDYTKILNPMVKPTTIHVVLTLALSNGWQMQQLDVNTSFLNKDIKEEVYMVQHKGFVSEIFPTHVCKLKKVIHGLKQALRAWYLKLNDFLQQLCFQGTNVDASMMLYNNKGTMVIFFIYVDDILITENDLCFIQSIVKQHNLVFFLKELVNLGYFFGC